MRRSDSRMAFWEIPRRSAESNRKAYELRDRASDREKFFITATYELQVTGNLERALQTCELWLQTYPREKVPHGLLGAMLYPTFGQYEKGVEVAKQLIEIDPDFSIGYLQLAFNNQFAGHLGEAENALQRASDRKLEIPELLIQRYDVAFLKGDQAGMDREVARGQKESGAEDMIADRQAFVWAYSGHLEKGEVNGPACGRLESAAGPAGKESAHRDRTGTVGSPCSGMCLPPRGARRPQRTFQLIGMWNTAQPSPWLSRGNLPAHEHSRRIWTRASRRIRRSNLFTCQQIRALLALNDDSKEGGASKAIELLQLARPYDRGIPPSNAPMFIGPLYPIYVRGLAYLAAHRAAEAAAEFQKILDHRGIVVSDPIGALAHLQLGRALMLSSNTTKAKSAYQDFLTLWKDADADIPILKQAQAEYTKLQ